jgi:hydrogenase/urease accessory protein HupE
MLRPNGCRAVLTILMLAAAATPALAHPGHGKDGGSHELTHYLTEPAHLAPLGLAALAGVGAAAFVVWYRRKA